MDDKKKYIKVYVIVTVVCFLFNTAKYFWPTPIRRDLRNLRQQQEIVMNNFESIPDDSMNLELDFEGDNVLYNYNTLIGNFQYDANNIFFPVIDNSIALLEVTEVSTPEAIALKNQYIESLEAYREGMEMMLTAVKTNNAEMSDKAVAMVKESEQKLQVYYENYNALAREHKFIYFD